MLGQVSRAKDQLDLIGEYLEDDFGLDLDFDDKSIQLNLPEYGLFLFSDHAVTGELWLSSPISGAHHFHFQDETWISTRDSTKLIDIIQKEIIENC